MRKEKTIFVCERCGVEKEASATKIGLIHKRASYPKDWKKVNRKLRVCPNCANDFDNMWNKYLAGGVVKESTKMVTARN